MTRYHSDIKVSSLSEMPVQIIVNTDMERMIGHLGHSRADVSGE